MGIVFDDPIDVDTDPDIEDIASLTPSTGDVLYWAGSSSRYDVTPSQSFGRSLLNLGSAAALAAVVAGSLISDSITNGVTSVAPSQNAVYDALLLKADLASPALTGIPTAPTAGSGTNTTQLATTAFVAAAISTAAGSYQPIDADLSSWASVVRAAGFDTFAVTPSSASLRSLVTDETGTGALVFATSPVLVTPNLGTPTAGVMNATTVTATGATTSRTMAARFGDLLSLSDFGGLTSDDSSAWAAYISAEGEGLYRMPEGVSISGKVTLGAKASLRGIGPEVSTVKLKNATNDHLIYTTGSDALWGTNTDAGVALLTLENLTLDGNRANQTSTNDRAVVASYGQKYRFRDLYVKDAREHGIRTEYYQYGDATFGMEGPAYNVVVDTAGKHGWLNKGPHDSIIFALRVIDSGQLTDNTYDGVSAQDYGASQYISSHVWNRGTSGVRNRYAWDMSSYGGTYVDVHGEGAKTAQGHIGGQYTQIIGSRFYASFAGASNLLIHQPSATYGAFFGGRAPGEDAVTGAAVAVVVGDGAVGENPTIVQVVGYVGGASHAASFGAAEAKNHFDLFGIIDMPTSGANANLPWLGTPNVTDYVNINVWDQFGVQHILRQFPGDTTFTGGITIGTSVIVGTTIELGHATANTLSASGGVLSIEGHAIPTKDQATNISAVWQFTANPAIVSASPALTFNETDGPTNEKLWYWTAAGGDFYLQADVDAGGAAVNALRIQRTGTTITNIDLLSSTLTLNSVALVTVSSADTLTNKILTTPTINGATMSGTWSGSHTVSGGTTQTGAFTRQATGIGQTLMTWQAVLSVAGTRSVTLSGPASDSATDYFIWGNGNAWDWQIDAVSRFRLEANGDVNFVPNAIFRITNATDSAANYGLWLDSDRATPAANDAISLGFRISSDAGTQTEVGSVRALATSVANGAMTSRLDFFTISGGTLANRMVLNATNLSPAANDGMSLGIGTFSFSDLFLASGAVINFNNGNYTVTHSAGLLTTNGALTLGGTLLFSSDATYEIGSTSIKPLRVWSQTIIAQGAAPNIDLRETGATANEGNWRLLADADTLNLQLFNDALNSAVNAMVFNRSGTTCDSLDLRNITKTIVNGLGVNNSASATVAVGTLAKKIEVFDGAGASLGYLPVYSTIT